MNKKVGRNDPCSCGSGKKYKKCCEAKHKHKKFDAKVLSSPSVAGAFFNQSQSVTSLFNRQIKPVTPLETPAQPEAVKEAESEAPEIKKSEEVEVEEKKKD